MFILLALKAEIVKSYASIIFTTLTVLFNINVLVYFYQACLQAIDKKNWPFSLL